MSRAPLIVGAVFLIVAFLWLRLDGERAREAYPPGSSLSTGPSGLSQARAYLAAQGSRVGSLTGAPGPDLPAGAVLLRFEPLRPLRLLAREEEIEPHEDAGASDGGADAGDAALLANAADAGAARREDRADAGAARADAGSARADAADAGSARADAADAGVDGGLAGFLREGWLESSRPFELSAGDEAFVRRGGRLVLAARCCAGLAQDGSAAPARAPAPPAAPGKQAGEKPGAPEAPQKILPVLPAVQHLALPAERALPPEALIDAQPVFEAGAAVAIARRTLGQGEVWLLDAPELLENQELGERDHLALLSALTSGRAPVLFDEASHGLRDGGLLSLLRLWGLGPALLLALCAGLLLFWRRAVTVGPPLDPFRDPRSEAVEFVDAMAGLLRRALSPAEALLLYRDRVLHELTLRLGPAEAARRLEGIHLPGPHDKLSKRELESLLHQLTNVLSRFRDEHHSRR